MNGSSSCFSSIDLMCGWLTLWYTYRDWLRERKKKGWISGTDEGLSWKRCDRLKGKCSRFIGQRRGRQVKSLRKMRTKRKGKQSTTTDRQKERTVEVEYWSEMRWCWIEQQACFFTLFWVDWRLNARSTVLFFMKMLLLMHVERKRQPCKYFLDVWLLWLLC